MPTAASPIASASERLSRIRRRLTMGLLVPFCVLMGAATIEGFWDADQTRQLVAVLILAAGGLTMPAFMAIVARGILRDAAALDIERAEMHELYGQARRAALLDGLTGLGNHRAFQDELARQLEEARRQGTPLALVLFDVDGLKAVNDSHGHASGDRLLVAVGQVAAAIMRRNDRAFRVGGDEFAVLLPNSDLEVGLAVGRRILTAALGGGDPGAPIEPFSLSIGVSAYPEPSTETHELLRQADSALYWCKRHGRTAVVAFDARHHKDAAAPRPLAELSADVAKVLASRALRPVYQPIFSLETGRPMGFEGLVRPGDGSPFADASSLFAAAEAANQTVELDLLCLEIVASGVGQLPDDAYLSVNLSPRTLESSLFRSGDLKGIFRRHGIPLDRIVLELTERETVEDLDQLRRNVEKCRAAGMRLAADDVGAGNAGLRLLSEIHFDVVKIDLSLVQGGIVRDPSHAVLRALQGLAAQWHASVVAEGVETSEQLAVVRDLGISAGQGYLLGRPGPDPIVDPVDIDVLMAPALLPPLSLVDLLAAGESPADRLAAQG
ncbi:MAG TPA: EAL domain-containing protein [Candidatus Limnocylindrales bacterium]